MELFFKIFVGKKGVFDYLQLMKFKYVNSCFANFYCGFYIIFSHFFWQPKNQMTTNRYTSFIGTSNCILRTFECVSSSYIFKRMIINTLYSILHYHECLSVKMFKIVKHLIRNTIRTSTYNYSGNIINSKSLFI